MGTIEKELHEAKSEIMGLRMQVCVLQQRIDDLKELLADEQRISTGLREENYRLRATVPPYYHNTISRLPLEHSS